MTTYTLTGNLGNLIGEDMAYVTARIEVTNAPYVIEEGEVRFTGINLPLNSAGVFTLAGIPSSITGYQYQVVAEYASGEMGVRNQRFVVGPFNLNANLDLADAEVVEAVPVRTVVYHAAVTGALALTAGTDHELDLTGNTAVTLTGNPGVEVGLFVHLNGHTLTVNGQAVTGDDPLTIVGKLWSTEWRIYTSTSVSGGALNAIDVTPTAPTFNDLSNSVNDDVVIPALTGVEYRIGLTTKTAGTYTLAALGLADGAVVTVNAYATTGYALTGTTTWTHDYSTSAGFAVFAADNFTAADTTAIVGRTTSTGSKTWLGPGSNSTGWKVIGNKAGLTPSGYDSNDLLLDTTTAPDNARITLTGATYANGANSQIMALVSYNDGAVRTAQIIMDGTGHLTCYDPGASPISINVTGLTATAVIIVTAVGAALTVNVGGTDVATATFGGPLSTKFGFCGQCTSADGIQLDTFQLETA